MAKQLYKAYLQGQIEYWNQKIENIDSMKFKEFALSIISDMEGVMEKLESMGDSADGLTIEINDFDLFDED